MRICLVTPEYPPRIGGLGYSTHRIADSIKKYTDCEVHVIAFENLWSNPDAIAKRASSESSVEQGIWVHRICLPIEDGKAFMPALYWSLGDLHAEYRFDALVGFSASALGFPITMFARQENVPVIVSLRGKDIHTDLFLRERFAHIKWALEYANSIVSVSKELLSKAELVADIRDRGTIIPNHICPSFFRDDTVEIPSLDREFIIATASVFRPSKGVELLLDAAAHLSSTLDLGVLLVGDTRPYQRDYLASILAKYRDSVKVWTTGFVEHANMLSYLRLADVFVSPSILDGCPNAVLEAMLAERPVIAARSGGVSEIISDGVDGLLVRPRSSQQLIGAISRLANDARLRSHLGHSGFEKVTKQFTCQHEAGAWNSVLKQICTQ